MLLSTSEKKTSHVFLQNTCIRHITNISDLLVKGFECFSEVFMCSITTTCIDNYQMICRRLGSSENKFGSGAGSPSEAA